MAQNDSLFADFVPPTLNSQSELCHKPLPLITKSYAPVLVAVIHGVYGFQIIVGQRCAPHSC